MLEGQHGEQHQQEVEDAVQLVLLAGVPGVQADEQGLGQPDGEGGLGCSIIHLEISQSLGGWWGVWGR